MQSDNMQSDQAWQMEVYTPLVRVNVFINFYFFLQFVLEQ